MNEKELKSLELGSYSGKCSKFGYTIAVTREFNIKKYEFKVKSALNEEGIVIFDRLDSEVGLEAMIKCGDGLYSLISGFDEFKGVVYDIEDIEVKKMKTVKYFFEELPEPYREMAIGNTPTEILDSEGANLTEALCSSFLFSTCKYPESLSGSKKVDFWNYVLGSVLSGLPIPESPKKTVKIHANDRITGSPYVSIFKYNTEQELENYLEYFEMGYGRITRIEEVEWEHGANEELR